MGRNIERAFLISYIDCADDILRKVIDEDLNGSLLLTKKEFEDIHDCNRLLISIIVRLQEEMSEEDPTRIIVPNVEDDC